MFKKGTGYSKACFSLNDVSVKIRKEGFLLKIVSFVGL